MKKVTTKIIHIPYLEFTRKETELVCIYDYKFNTNCTLEFAYDGWGFPITTNYTDGWSGKHGMIIGINYLCKIGTTIDISKYTAYKFIVLRVSKNNVVVNGKCLSKDYPLYNAGRCDTLYLGGRDLNGAQTFRACGNLYYFKIENKNSMLLHLLPCVRIYNLIDDNNELISENNIDYGFFESVNQDYYIADSNSIPAHTGDTLNDDYSNMLDINSNIINI